MFISLARRWLLFTRSKCFLYRSWGWGHYSPLYEGWGVSGWCACLFVYLARRGGASSSFVEMGDAANPFGRSGCGILPDCMRGRGVHRGEGRREEEEVHIP